MTPWGGAIAYERAPVRRFFIDNALYWLGEFRFDGLRLDAVDHIHDPDAPVEILAELAATVHSAFPGRPIHLTTEDNRNITRLHERGPDGTPRLYTAEWNDDLHNVAHRSPPARPRATTATSPRSTGASSPAPSPRASPTRASPRPTPAAPRAASRAATCRRSPSSISCRTTTRSATAPSASA